MVSRLLLTFLNLNAVFTAGAVLERLPKPLPASITTSLSLSVIDMAFQSATQTVISAHSGTVTVAESQCLPTCPTRTTTYISVPTR